MATFKSIYKLTKNFEKYCWKHKDEIYNLPSNDPLIQSFNQNLQLKTLLHYTVISNLNSPLWEITPFIIELISKTNPIPISQTEIYHTLNCIKNLPNYSSKYNNLITKLTKN